MQIIMKDLTELKPYKNNPRNNKKAVKEVAASIKEFGFKVPIVIDGAGVIVCGHTRYAASKQLGLTEVPCIVADDLTDEQIRAFRLADNKVSEKATWDIGLLSAELEALDFDMTAFGFPELLPDPGEDEEREYGDERERTADAYNLTDFDATRVAGFYQMPIIEPCKVVPKKLIGFNYVLSSGDKYTDCGVHFFLDDYQFERIWNDPQTYIEKLSKYDCVLTPDFSLYLDMPVAMQIWNVYRSRLIGQMMQSAGIKVIPTLSWARSESFQFCFDGLQSGGTVAVSTVGVMRSKEAQDLWKAGMDEALKRIQPKTILIYGSDIEYDFHKAKVVQIAARKFSD